MPIIDWSSKRIKIDPGADISEILEALQKDLDSKVTAAVLNAALAAEKGERVEGDELVLANSKVEIVEEEPESGVHNGYRVYQGNELVAHIHTPQLIKNAYLEKEADVTYLVLEFAGAVEPVKIDVSDLIDIYKGSKGSMIEVAIDDNNVISASIVDGSITRNKVAEDIESSLQKADDAAAYTDEQVANEKAAREAEDTRIEGLVTEEENARITGDTELRTSIEEEATRAKGAEEALQSALNAEKAAREAADVVLDEKISAAVERATNKESELNAAIEAEQSRAEGVEEELNEAIAKEVSDRESAINEEAEARIAGDSEEKTRAEAKEAALESAITKEVADRQEAVEDAIQAAKDDNDALHSTISGEWSAADEALKEEIQEWVNEKKYATVAYVDSIDATKADRSELNSKIAEEITNRENADQATITAAKAYTDEKAAEVEAKIPSLENYATEEWVESQNYLTEHQSLAEYRKAVDQDVIDAEKALKADTYTKTQVDELLESAGKVKDVQVNGESVVEDGVAGIAVKTINGSSIVGEGNLEVGVTPEEKALIDTIPSKADKSDLEDYRTATEQDAIDATKQSVIEDLDDIREGAEKGATAIQKVKTINGNSIEGEGDVEISGVTEEQAAEIAKIKDKADKSEVSSISSVVSETQVLLRREVEAREGLSEFVGDTPLTTSAQTVTGAIEELKAGGASIKVDNKTIEIGSDGLHIKNEGVTRSKINSEAGVVFEDDNQELTNKTIDATKNTIKNLPAASITAIDTSAFTVTDDTHIPTSKLVKNYADTKISIPSTRANKIMAWNSSGNVALLSFVKTYEHYCVIKRNASTDDTSYITFSIQNETASPTNAQLVKWLYDNGFTAKNKAYPAGGLAAANTIYVASASGGANTTSFSATSCINGIYSPNGTKLNYVYRTGTEVNIDLAKFVKIKTIDRGYKIIDG